MRKELKIKDQIGVVNQNDKLTYVSLMHQIDEAKQTWYGESEIVSSVNGAMIPSPSLRNALEACQTYHSTNFFNTWKHILMSGMLQIFAVNLP